MKKEFKVIADIIQNNKRVLDIGCGDGTLMEYLKINQKNDVRGLEPKKNLVQKCISKGLSVIEGDAEKELAQFPEKSFDYVVLSQTLQAFLYPEEVLNQLLRIGKQNGRASLLFVRWSCERLDKYDAEKEQRRLSALKGWETRRQKILKKLKEAKEE